METATQIPLVDYLVLGDEPHLVANECIQCGARFFDRRNACASCSGTDFVQVSLSPTGTLRTFTIVAQAAPGVPVPFVAGIFDCDGTTVRANLVNVAPDPRSIRFGMAARLVPVPIGTDSHGTDAVGFAFEPLEEAHK